MSDDPAIMRPAIKEKLIVDEETIEIGKNTEKTSNQETKRMLEQQLDTMDRKDPARKVYEKVYSGIKRFN